MMQRARLSASRRRSAGSPDFAALLGRADHRGARLAGERLLELGEVRDRSDDTVLRDRMRVALDHRAGGLGAGRVAAELPPRDEELLVGSEAVLVGQGRLPAPRDLEGAVGDLRAGEVPDRLAQDEPAVVVESGLDEIVLELVDDTGALLLELLQVVRRPPVVQAPLR